MKADAELPWRGHGSLTRRILAVNLLALALLGGSLFYLDNFRVRLIEERRAQAENGAQLVAAALAAAPRRERAKLIATLGKRSGERLRLYSDKGKQILDSWEEGPATYAFAPRTDEPWDNQAARVIDRVVDRIVGAQVPPAFVDYGEDARAWPELRSVLAGSTVSSRIRLASDRTVVTTAATAVNAERTLFVLAAGNARDVTRLVRAERYRLAMITGATLALSILLSLFLARTIVSPLQRLAVAAVRVRLGRSREVVVPRLPTRNDEIGMLARAVSDMTQALRERIDATETFAADVAHELKNPLASLGSAIESLAKTRDPDIQAQLHAIVADDVRRLDRMISDISELSRLDAQLTRARFEAVDLRDMLDRLVDAYAMRRTPEAPPLAYTRPEGTMAVLADEQRLARAIDNLITNAASFSPPGASVRLRLWRGSDSAVVQVDDDGPGVPFDQRSAIFQRFHSDRPEAHRDGHSGLGLAIAKTIVEGHNGAVSVGDADSGAKGARFTVRLPLA